MIIQTTDIPHGSTTQIQKHPVQPKSYFALHLVLGLYILRRATRFRMFAMLYVQKDARSYRHMCVQLGSLVFFSIRGPIGATKGALGSGFYKKNSSLVI